MNILRMHNETCNWKTISGPPLRVTFYARVSIDKADAKAGWSNEFLTAKLSQEKTTPFKIVGEVGTARKQTQEAAPGFLGLPTFQRSSRDG